MYHSGATQEERQRRKQEAAQFRFRLNRRPVTLTQEEEKLLGQLENLRPRTRGECDGVQRPCPFVGCRHHLLFEVNKQGSIHCISRSRRFADPTRLPPEFSCSLDVADQGGHTLEQVAEAMGITREGVRKIEESALKKLKTSELGKEP